MARASYNSVVALAVLVACAACNQKAQLARHGQPDPTPSAEASVSRSDDLKAADGTSKKKKKPSKGVDDEAVRQVVYEAYTATGAFTSNDTLFELLLDRALHAKYGPRPSWPPVYTKWSSAAEKS